MKYADLHQAVQSAAGLRLRLRLQPLYGTGEIVFPCTVAGGKYQISNRRIPGYDQSVLCVILDSVQSQANRMEDALLSDIRAGKLQIPHVATSFSGIEGLEKEIGEITCFEAPHRIFDAILRDSVDAEGTHFPLTDLGRRVIQASSKDATAIFQTSPASLLFGSWDSTGISGGLGEKYTRCVVSEVVGINTEKSDREGFRIDPLNVAKAASPKKILEKTPDEIWTKLKGSGKKIEDPSGILHGNIPWPGKDKKSGEMHGGVTCDYIQQSTTISFPALRQLGFPIGDPVKSARAHAVLAAIALHAAALNVEKGWHLRSRCDLILDDGASSEWEILGAAPAKETLSADTTRDILKEAITEAKKAGLPWNDEPVRLTPSAALKKLVVDSQKAHRASSPE
ncbi:MAG: type I-U CRISPR-associated protein Cas7 [Verrucomicrobiaceae bacterium]|nr:type I-U CRISPR-associated protein Cas7 [Verrucomicrobiaceae bacterium]